MFKKKLLTIIILGFLIYSNILTAPFVFDDERSVYQNPITLDFNKAISSFSLVNFRYLSQLSFALNYQISQNSTFLYHLVNLLIHITSSVVAWRLAILILQTPKINKNISKHKEAIGFFVALIFLSHPLQTQAVSYITQRYASMATMFYYSAILFYLKARIEQVNKKSQENIMSNFFLSFLMLIFAIYSKEISVSLPLMIIAIELFFFEHKNILKKTAVIFPIFIGFIGAVIWARGIKNIFYTITSPLGESITSYNYFLTQSRVILKYIQLLFLPFRQSADYYFPISTNILDPRVIVSIIILISILALAIFFYKKYKLLSFSIFWFFIALSVESSIVPIDDVIFEHRLYLPMFGFALGVASALWYLLNYFKKINIYKNTLYLLIIIYGFLTFNRNFIWTNEVKFWADVVKKAPQKAKGYGALGVAYDKAGELDKAVQYYEKSIELNPGLADLYLKLHNNLGFTKSKQGKYAEAEEHYYKVLEISPNFLQTRINLAQLYSQTQEHEKAIEQLEKTIVIQPDFYLLYHNLGISYMKIKNYQKAEENLLKAYELNPNSIQTRNALNQLSIEKNAK